MDYEKLIENLECFKRFESIFKAGKLSQAYLFACPDSLTNKILIKHICKMMMCESHTACGVCPDCLKISIASHPDVFIYPKDKAFNAKEAGEIYDTVNLKPLYKDFKIYVIYDLDLATVTAQNKMLKIIEEPPENVIFLFSTTKEDKVLPTIKSRVQTMMVDRLKKSDIENLLTGFDQTIVAVAKVFGDGYLGNILNISQNVLFIENYKNMLNLVKNLKKSDQIPSFCTFLSKDRQVLKNDLEILSSFYSDMLFIKLDKKDLLKNANILRDLEMLAEEFSVVALNEILKRLNYYNKISESNVSLVSLVDNLLLDILEIKYLCK